MEVMFQLQQALLWDCFHLFTDKVRVQWQAERERTRYLRFMVHLIFDKDSIARLTRMFPRHWEHMHRNQKSVEKSLDRFTPLHFSEKLPAPQPSPLLSNLAPSWLPASTTRNYTRAANLCKYINSRVFIYSIMILVLIVDLFWLMQSFFTGFFGIVFLWQVREYWWFSLMSCFLRF